MEELPSNNWPGTTEDNMCIVFVCSSTMLLCPQHFSMRMTYSMSSQLSLQGDQCPGSSGQGLGLNHQKSCVSCPAREVILFQAAILTADSHRL